MQTRSNKSITFGVRVPNSGPLASPRSMVRVARESEALHFDSIWVHDHLTWTSEMHRTHISSGSDAALEASQTPDFYESLTTLAFLAACVHRVRLGVACLVVPTKNPVHLAKQVASLDVMAEGRLDVGVGIGSPATLLSREYEVTGVDRKVRGKMADDYIQAMKCIWSGNPSSHEGPFVRFQEAEIFPKPRQKPHPPLWVGGWTEAAMKRTARLGDVWVPAWLMPEEIRSRFGSVRAMAGQAGRNPEALELGIEVYTSIDRKAAAARDNATGTIRSSRGTYERKMSVEELSRVSLIGSPEEISDQIAAYHEAGVRHFEMKFIYPSIERLFEMMRLFSEAVLPNFAGL